MVLEARGNATYTDLQHAVDTLMHYAQECPEISGLSSSLQNDIPQFYYDVDRDKARLQGGASRRYIRHDESLHRLGLHQ